MPADNLIEAIVDFTEREAYTDILIWPGEHTRIKTPLGWVPVGELTDGGRPAAIDQQMLVKLIGTLCGEDDWLEQMRKTKRSRSFMMPLDRKGARLRFKVAQCTSRDDVAGKADAFTVNIRKLPAAVPTLQVTGLPQTVGQMLTRAGGLVLVTGTVCSGKTTTLASLVDFLNHQRRANIITLERLTEYVFKSDKSVIIQRTVPENVSTFLEGIEDALDGQAVDVLSLIHI